ncbi:MAG: CheY-like chemotaxis protein [Zhongshania sp.]
MKSHNNKPKLWIVDDAEADRITFKESLRRLGATATVIEFTGGGQIMAELSGMEVKAHPGIVLLDINVRRMNEMLALGKIRGKKAFINVYIVMQTASKQGGGK